MTRSQFSELRVHQIGSALGARVPRFSRRLFENYPYGAEYGCSIERFERRPIPLHVWAMVAIGVVGFIVIWFTK